MTVSFSLKILRSMKNGNLIVQSILLCFLSMPCVPLAQGVLNVGVADSLFQFHLPTDSRDALWPGDSPIPTLKLSGSPFTRFFFNNQFKLNSGRTNGVVPVISSFDIYEGFASNPRQKKINNDDYLASNNKGTVCRIKGGFQGGTMPADSAVFTYRSPFKGIACDTVGKVQAVWLTNIHSLSPDTLLGFLHIETSDSGQDYQLPVKYSIGLARSTDGGQSWLYLGEIIKPQNQHLASGTLLLPNVGGVPYLIIKENGVDYIYVYFSDYGICTGRQDSMCTVDIGCLNPLYPKAINTVARARLDSVRKHVSLGDVGVRLWKKLDQTNPNSWTGDGFNGLGTEILRPINEPARIFYPLHGDAIKYRTASDSGFLLVVPTNESCRHQWRSTIYRSQNGTTWEKYLDVAPKDSLTFGLAHPVFVSDNPITNDGLVMGGAFWLYFAEADNHLNTSYYYDFYRKALSFGPLSPFVNGRNPAAKVDYDGDGKADISEGSGNYFRVDYSGNGLGSVDQIVSNGQYTVSSRGVPGDYDGDGLTDRAIRIAQNGVWNIDYGKTGFNGFEAGFVSNWGNSSSIPVPADYDGDGKTDLAIFNNYSGNVSGYVIDYSSNGFNGQDFNSWYRGLLPSDTPTPADYDGDGKADLSIKNIGGHWGIDFAVDGFNGYNAIYTGFGGSSFVPAPADFDGDGKADLVVMHKASGGSGWGMDFSANGFGTIEVWRNAHITYSYTKPMPSDYDGDGFADIAVKNDDGYWAIDYAVNGFGNWDMVSGNWGDASAQPFHKPAVLNPEVQSGVMPYDFAFILPRDTRVKVVAFTLDGKQIATLFEGHLKEGANKIGWTKTELFAKGLKSGIYMLSLQANGFKASKKVFFSD
jgi:hypothetical protein